MNPVQRKIVNPNTRVNPMLDKQIEALEKSNGDLNGVFDEDELRDIQTLGCSEYLALLKRVKQSMNDSGSEE